MEPLWRTSYFAYLLPFLGSSMVGFLLPYWIHSGLLASGETCSASRRGVRSIRSASSPDLSATLDIRHVDILDEAYYVDSDVMYTSAGEKDDQFIFVEVITRAPRYSYTPPFIEDKHTRHIYLSSGGNISDGVRYVFRTICQRKSRDRYSWTVLVGNGTYVNTYMLRHFLPRLPTSVPVLIGKTVPDGTELCSLTEGVLMNSAAMRLFCKNPGPEVNECEEGLHASEPDACLMRRLRVGCTDITQKLPEFYRSVDDNMADGESAVGDLTYKSAFIGRNLTGDDMSRLHGDVLDVRIRAVHRRLELLTDRRHNAASAQRLKRDSQDNSRTTKHGLPLPYFLRNESSLPGGVYLPIDDRGILTRPHCVGSPAESLDLNNVSTSYRETMRLATGSTGGATPTAVFGFKLHKPNYGHEYHIHVLREASTRYGAGRAYQLITCQRYDRPAIRHKRVVVPRPLLVLVALPTDGTDVRHVVRRAATAVGAVRAFGGGAAVLFTYCSAEAEAQLTAILRELDKRSAPFRLAKRDRLSEVLSRYGDDWILARVPENVVFQAGFLLRCGLHVAAGRSAYFPIPLLRNDVPTTSENPRLDPELKWQLGDRDSWQTSNFESYCIEIADVKRVASAGYDITNGRDVYNAARDRLRIRRIIDGNLQQLKLSASGNGCQTER